MPAPPTPGRRERPGAARVVVAAHRRWIAAAAALVAATATSLALPASAHGSDETPTQWQIDARAEALQRAPEPAEKPVICIIDTGVTPTPDLDIVSRTALDGGTPDDVTAIPGHYGHGTTVAHMAAAKVNGWGSSGAFPHARIASVRIFDRLGQRVPWQRYVRALQWCANVRPTPVAAVVAVGGPGSGEPELIDFRTAVHDARGRQGISVVAAAGNAAGAVEMPARFPEALAVAGIDSGSDLCAFSAHGDGVDLSAPGCSLHQAGWDASTWNLDGTSFSAPVVAGVLAALRSYRPEITADVAERAILSSVGDSGTRPLDARGALLALGLRTVGRLDPDAVPVGGGQEFVPAQQESEPALESPDATLIAPVHSLTRSRGAVVAPMHRPRLPRPRAALSGRGRLLRLRVLGPTRAVSVEIATSGRSIISPRRKFTWRAPWPSRLRIRFVNDLDASPWLHLPIRRRKR